MFNPLVQDPTKLKDQELENKILDLTKKFHIALKLGQGGLANQIAVTLDQYIDEQRIRQERSLKEIQDKQKKQGLDDLINVD
jgi:hypothetical protein